MNKENSKLLIVILLVVTALFYIQIMKLPINAFDEGTMLYGAERLLKGDIPHKDFATEYPAGQISVLAILFKVFGTSVTTARIYDIIVKTLLSLFIFINIRLLSSTRFALTGWAMSLIWIIYKSNPEYPIYPFFLLIFVGVYFLILHMKQQKDHYLVVSAVLIAISIPFRIDLGVPAAGISIFVLFLRKFIGAERSWKPLGTFTASGVIATFLIMGFYAAHSTVQLMFSDLILNPMAFLEHRWFPYPSLNRNSLPFYVFPACMVIGVVFASILIKRRTGTTAPYILLIISLFGVISMNQARVRSDMIHLLPVALNTMLLAPMLLYELPKILPLKANQYRAACLLFALVFCATLYNPVKAIAQVVERTNGFIMEVTNPDIERARYSTIFGDMKYVIPYIRDNTSEDDYIYVGVTNHDQFLKNDPLIYFLAERNCPSRYHELNPGVNNTKKGQEDMVRELKVRPPRMVILVPRWREEPNPSNIDQNLNLIDNYISDNYEYKKSFGMYEVWLRINSS